VAPQRDEIFKQKVNDCVQHIILQKFTNFHTIQSWNFQNICNEIGWPRFFAPPCILYTQTTHTVFLRAKVLLYLGDFRCLKKIICQWTKAETENIQTQVSNIQLHYEFPLFAFKCRMWKKTQKINTKSNKKILSILVKVVRRALTISWPTGSDNINLYAAWNVTKL